MHFIYFDMLATKTISYASFYFSPQLTMPNALLCSNCNLYVPSKLSQMLGCVLQALSIPRATGCCAKCLQPHRASSPSRGGAQQHPHLWPTAPSVPPLLSQPQEQPSEQRPVLSVGSKQWSVIFQTQRIQVLYTDFLSDRESCNFVVT